jgi:hypothetical protein
VLIYSKESLDENGNVEAASLAEPIEFCIGFPREKFDIQESFYHRVHKIGFEIQLEQSKQLKFRVLKVPKIMVKKFPVEDRNECIQRVYSILEAELKVSHDKQITF